MLKHADPILKVCLGVGALLAGAGVGYYYGIYLPAQDIHRQTAELVEKQSRAAQQSRALADRARREQAAQAAYGQCVAYAEDAYRQRWNQACQAMHDADQAAFDDCADDLFSTRRGCLAKFPIRPARDCALPSETAGSLGAARDQRKAQCAQQLQAEQRDRTPVGPDTSASAS